MVENRKKFPSQPSSERENNNSFPAAEQQSFLKTTERALAEEICRELPDIFDKKKEKLAESLADLLKSDEKRYEEIKQVIIRLSLLEYVIKAEGEPIQLTVVKDMRKDFELLDLSIQEREEFFPNLFQLCFESEKKHLRTELAPDYLDWIAQQEPEFQDSFSNFLNVLLLEDNNEERNYSLLVAFSHIETKLKNLEWLQDHIRINKGQSVPAELDAVVTLLDEIQTDSAALMVESRMNAGKTFDVNLISKFFPCFTNYFKPEMVWNLKNEVLNTAQKNADSLIANENYISSYYLNSLSKEQQELLRQTLMLVYIAEKDEGERGEKILNIQYLCLQELVIKAKKYDEQESLKKRYAANLRRAISIGQLDERLIPEVYNFLREERAITQNEAPANQK